jgi:hypothetical protein
MVENNVYMSCNITANTVYFDRHNGYGFMVLLQYRYGYNKILNDSHRCWSIE